MSTTCICLYIQRSSSWGARVAQWWEHSSPTNVAWVRVLASTSNVGRVCCRFSPLFREVFLRVLRFSPLLKNQNVQIPIGPSQESGRRRPPSGSATTKLLFIYLFILLMGLLQLVIHMVQNRCAAKQATHWRNWALCFSCECLNVLLALQQKRFCTTWVTSLKVVCYTAVFSVGQ